MGCVYNNFLLALGESFLIACQRRCTCERPDFIACQVKTCPPVVPRDRCQVETDPSDPCCQVLVCQEEEDLEESETRGDNRRIQIWEESEFIEVVFVEG